MKSSLLEKIIMGIGVFTGFAALLAIICCIITYPVMWLWNGCLVGTVDGIHPLVGFWHTLGMLILCGLLFRSSSGSSKK